MRQLSNGASGKTDIKTCRGYLDPCLSPPGCCSPKLMECRRDPDNGDFLKKCHEKAFEVVPLGVDPPEDPIPSNGNINKNGDVEYDFLGGLDY